MMSLIFLLLTLSLVLINLTGLGLAAGRLIGHHGLARFAGLASVVLLLFFVEHFQGLGSLVALWPLSTALSLYLIYRYRDPLQQKRDLELVFAGGLVYGMLWRFVFPDMTTSGESITNLAFIANYQHGSTLPPVDHWLPPWPFDYYYSLQHYAAALAGRVLGLEPGYSYNLAMGIATGLIAELCWNLAKTLNVRPALRLLVLITLIVGGNGVAPFQSSLWSEISETHTDPAIEARMSLWHSTRFIGLYDARTNTPFAERLLGNARTGEQTVELPLETIGYLTLQGDYHAPLGGFILLLFALGLMARLSGVDEAQQTKGYLAALLGLSLPLVLAVNAWTFPLQGLLITTWMAQRQINRQPLNFYGLIAGALIGFVLLYPFLAGFASTSRSLALQWVPDTARTPWQQFLVLHWPWLLLSGFALTTTRWRTYAWTLTGCLALVILASELITLGDNDGRYLRFNTTLKWWSWIHVAVITGLASLALTSRWRAIRLATTGLLLALCVQALDLGRYMYHQPKPHVGQLQGYGSVASIHGYDDLLIHLQQAPSGIVLERPLDNRGAYIPTTTLALLSGHAAFIGWPDHLVNWGQPPQRVRQRVRAVETFYNGQHPDAAGWLMHNDIDYIVWRARDNGRTPGAFETINNQIRQYYRWQEYRSGEHWRTGLWIRRAHTGNIVKKGKDERQPKIKILAPDSQEVTP